MLDAINVTRDTWHFHVALVWPYWSTQKKCDATGMSYANTNMKTQFQNNRKWAGIICSRKSRVWGTVNLFSLKFNISSFSTLFKNIYIDLYSIYFFKLIYIDLHIQYLCSNWFTLIYIQYLRSKRFPLLSNFSGDSSASSSKCHPAENPVSNILYFSSF